MAAAVDMPQKGRWDTVLEFGTYQHTTVDGKPVTQKFDASRAQATLDDFEQHPESDIFYDRFHEVTTEVPGQEGEAITAYRARLESWARGGDESDGKAMAWANALAMVVGGQVTRYIAHPGAPEQPPTIQDIAQGLGKQPPDGVYCYRSEITKRGADPKEGIDAFRYTSPYFVSQRDGDRLLNLTCTNDPRMRGAALARFERAPRFVTMTRMTATAPTENTMDKEMMARVGFEESDTPAAQLEKFAKYVRKMEEDSKKKDDEAKEVMARVQKMEEDKKKDDDEKAEMKRKMEAGENPFAKKDEEEKSAMQAMQRRMATLEQQNSALEQGLKQSNARVAELTKQSEADQKVAMERTRKEQEVAAAKWAEEALVRGQWNSMHQGTEADKPEVRIAMTRTFLENQHRQGNTGILFPAGTFQPDQVLVMNRMTENGAGIGQPDPRDDANPVRAMDRAIARRQKQNKEQGKDEPVPQIMARIKKEEPHTYIAYERAKRQGVN